MKDVELTVARLAALTEEVRNPGGSGDASVAKAFNAALADALRAGKGQLSGELAGRKLLILTTTGRRSGRQITTVLRYTPLHSRLFVVASMGGAERHPQWYLNLLATPRAQVEVDGETFSVDAVTLEGDERETTFAHAARVVPVYNEYRARTQRQIPVVELVRAT
jgi:deazaflavin-dependent oxidoreductase (nitroreductase family)